MQILHLEDDRQDAELVRATLLRQWPDLQICLVTSRDQFTAELQPDRYDLILSDYRLPDFNGLDALRLARVQTPETPFVFLSGMVGEEKAAELVRAGAADYLLKDRMASLPLAVDRAIREHAELVHAREAQRRIREQAELLNQARDGIVVADTHGQVAYWNRGAERLFGWPAADAIHRDFTSLFGPAVVHDLAALLRRIDLDGSWYGELVLDDREQRHLTVEIRGNLIFDERGQAKSRLLIITDISERKTLEAQFLRVQRLESLGMLAAGIAHDLNNILAPVLIGVPMLRSLAAEPADREVINAIEKSAGRGAALVRQILSFAQGSAGQATLLQPKHLIREVAELVSQTFPKEITLQTHIPSQIRTVLGNPTQLHQVLLNLCVNARDAMPDGGRLSLNIADVELSAEQAASHPGAAPGHFVLLTVGDTGTGIPPELLASIWEPFFTTKEVGKGTGLGLSTVRGIVASHHGFTSVESTLGVGTTFRVYLPASEPPTSSSRSPLPPRETTKHGRGELILVVDDEATIRSLLSAILRRDGYRVVTAANGAEAVALVRPDSSAIQLIITDLAMPEMGGLQLADEIRLLHPTMKILYMSGAPGVGPNGHRLPPAAMTIAKPFSTDELLVRLRAELDAK